MEQMRASRNDREKVRYILSKHDTNEMKFVRKVFDALSMEVGAHKAAMADRKRGISASMSREEKRSLRNLGSQTKGAKLGERLTGNVKACAEAISEASFKRPVDVYRMVTGAWVVTEVNAKVPVVYSYVGRFAAAGYGFVLDCLRAEE